MFLKRSLFAIFLPLLLVSILVAACGGSNSTTSTATSTATSIPTAGNGSPYATSTGVGHTTPVPTMTAGAIATTAPGNSSATIRIGTATIAGNKVAILTNLQGLTLYYNTDDTPATVTCTGGCAAAWPPLLFKGSGKPVNPPTLTGALTVFRGPDGAQVEYQGHPLYTYAADTAPGQTKGEGKGNVWYVAMPGLLGNGSNGD